MNFSEKWFLKKKNQYAKCVGLQKECGVPSVFGQAENFLTCLCIILQTLIFTNQFIFFLIIFFILFQFLLVIKSYKLG